MCVKAKSMTKLSVPHVNLNGKQRCLIKNSLVFWFFWLVWISLWISEEPLWTEFDQVTIFLSYIDNRQPHLESPGVHYSV